MASSSAADTSRRLASVGSSRRLALGNPARRAALVTPWDLFFGGTKKAVIQQVDTGNCIDGGGDPVALIKAYPGRTTTIHIKEFSKTKPDAFVTEGDMPWKTVFEACETVGGTEWYIVEYEHESQPAIPAVGRCLANLRKLGK